MCSILGKAPLFGLMTDEGRRATWLVEVKTRRKPDPHLLSSAIGIKVIEDVLARRDQRKLNLPVYMCSAPDVIAVIKKDHALLERLEKVGARLTPICPLMYMYNPSYGGYRYFMMFRMQWH